MNQGIVILIMQEVKKLMTTQLRKLGLLCQSQMTLHSQY